MCPNNKCQDLNLCAFTALGYMEGGSKYKTGQSALQSNAQSVFKL